MPTKSKTTEKAPSAEQRRAPQPDDKSPNEFEQGVHPALALERAKALPSSALKANDILALQRTIGNRAVQRLLSSQTAEPPVSASNAPPVIQAKLMVGPANDHYEQEADRMAQKVTSEPIAKHGAAAIQRQTDEDEPVQRKPLAASITPLVQRQQAPDEDKEIQTKRTRQGEGFAAGGELESRLQASRGSGSPLPDTLRSRMEQSFGASFENVRIHHGDEADRLNQSLQSRAFTTGQDLYFKRGEYHPESQEGQRLIAHELTHVMHQKGGGNTSNKVGVSSGQNSTIQRVWWKPWTWFGSATPIAAKEPETVASQTDRTAAAPTTDRKEAAPTVEAQEDPELTKLRNKLPAKLNWAKRKTARIYSNREALEYIKLYQDVFAATISQDEQRLRALSFDELKDMKREDTERKQQEEAKQKEKEAKQKKADEKKIEDNKTSLVNKVATRKNELKGEAVALGLVWDTKWEEDLTARRNSLDLKDDWYKTATDSTLGDKAGDIKKYVSKQIAMEKADVLLEKQGEKGLGAKNQFSLGEQLKAGTLPLAQFSEDAKRAIKKQGKLSMADWKNALKFTDYSQGTQKLDELDGIETHLTLDDQSFQEPRYDNVDQQTPEMIMEKLLKIPAEWKQIHVTVRTRHIYRNKEKNPHLYWFGELRLKDKGGNWRFSAPLTEDRLKGHMTKQLEDVKKDTATKIKSTIDLLDTTK